MLVCGTVGKCLSLSTFLARAFPLIITPKGNFHSFQVPLKLGRMHTMNPLEVNLRELQTTLTSTGILTCCPSPTLIRLGLGPTNPGTITVALETLLLRPTGFSPVLRLLIPAFSLDTAPQNFTILLHCNINAPLPLLVN